MKKLSLVILGILIGAFATYYFCPECAGSTSVEEMAIVKPKGLINPAQASALDKAFDSRHQLISDSIVKRPDNRSSWYSLADIEDYIKYADSQATGLGYDMDGIRIYLGAHANSGGNVGYTTMFLVPTGVKSLSKGSSSLFNLTAVGGDIPGGDGLNDGDSGNPPAANYPQ